MSDHVPPPLPGRSPGEAVSLLAHRVFGPLQRRPTRVVLDYHGLANRPAAVLTEIAGRHGVTTRTVSVNVARIRAAADLSLTPDTVEEAVRPSTPDEDHLGRTRVAATLHLPAPARAERPRTPTGWVGHRAR